jgi:hypothetical protein
MPPANQNNEISVWFLKFERFNGFGFGFSKIKDSIQFCDREDFLNFSLEATKLKSACSPFDFGIERYQFIEGCTGHEIYSVKVEKNHVSLLDRYQRIQFLT